MYGAARRAGSSGRQTSQQKPCQGSRETASVRENVGIVVAEQVQAGSGRQEGEARFGQGEPVFTNEQGLKAGPEGVEVEHVGGGVGELLRRQFGRAPVRTLLLLVEFDSQQFLAEITQAVTVGEGAHQLGGDLGAADRRDGDAQGVLEDGDVEPGEMHELEVPGSASRRARLGQA